MAARQSLLSVRSSITALSSSAHSRLAPACSFPVSAMGVDYASRANPSFFQSKIPVRHNFQPPMRKHAKHFRGPIKTRAHTAIPGWPNHFPVTPPNPATGITALVSKNGHRIKADTIEAVRQAVRRVVRKSGGDVRFIITPNIPVSKKPVGVRMGRGKGAVDHYIARLSAGYPIFIIYPSKKAIQRKALESGASLEEANQSATNVSEAARLDPNIVNRAMYIAQRMLPVATVVVENFDPYWRVYQQQAHTVEMMNQRRMMRRLVRARERVAEQLKATLIYQGAQAAMDMVKTAYGERARKHIEEERLKFKVQVERNKVKYASKPSKEVATFEKYSNLVVERIPDAGEIATREDIAYI